ncbi:MAG: hypothetical protein HQM03_19820 [Magnetococcales bacterium]|nr:hypothetical protein [Magnetococcales bacterium]
MDEAYRRLWGAVLVTAWRDLQGTPAVRHEVLCWVNSPDFEMVTTLAGIDQPIDELRARFLTVHDNQSIPRKVRHIR